MKSLKENVNGIALCIFELIVGILLMINPVGFTSMIIQITGAVMAILGIVEIVKYFRMDTKEAAIGQTLTKGILILLGGLFCVLKTEWFIVTFPVLTILYGIAILAVGIGKIQLTVDMIRRKYKKWLFPAINAVVSIICAVVILQSPFTSTVVLWVFTGISLIVEGVLDIVTMILGGKSPKKDKEGR